jgi:hypothetical protein
LNRLARIAFPVEVEIQPSGKIVIPRLKEVENVPRAVDGQSRRMTPGYGHARIRPKTNNQRPRLGNGP